MSSPPPSSSFTSALLDTLENWKTLWYFWGPSKGTFAACPYFKSRDDGAKDDEAARVAALRRHARVHVFSLALIMKLWNRPHYRHGS